MKATDERIDVLIKEMYKLGYQQQGCAFNGLGVQELTFWYDMDSDHRVRFFFTEFKKCESCTVECYPVQELTKYDVVTKNTTSCQWLNNAKLVRMKNLCDRIFRAKEEVRVCEEELKKLL